MNTPPIESRPKKEYLGDAVYADIDQCLALILTTEDGIRATNTVILEPDVLEVLFAYSHRHKLLEDSLGQMSDIEQAAIKLHDFLWDKVGLTDEWPLQFSGDDDALPEALRLLNELQDAIKASGFASREYAPRGT